MVRLPQRTGLAIFVTSLAITASGGCDRRSDLQTPETAQRDVTAPSSGTAQGDGTGAGAAADATSSPQTAASAGPAIGAGREASSGVGEGATSIPVDPAQLRAQILSAMEAGDDDLAFDLVRTAKRMFPNDPQVTFLMALILGQRNRFPEAIRMLDAMARSIPSTQATVLGQTADWLVESGQWPAAEARYRELLHRAPDTAIAHRKLAELLVRQGRRQEAATHYRQLCRLGDVEEIELRSLLSIVHPFGGDAVKPHLEPIGSLGNARFAIGVGNWTAAAAALELSPSAYPTAASALRVRIQAQLQNFEPLAKSIGDTPAAEQLPADYWFALGTLQAHRGQHRAAVISFCQTVLRDETDAEAYAAMSRSLQAMGASTEAAVAAERAGLIERTQEIGAEMAKNTDRDDAQLASLIKALQQLNRPFEAIAWKAMQVVYRQANSSLSETDARQRLAELVAERKEQLGISEPDASRDFLLCGVDLESLGVEVDASAEAGGQN